MVYTRYVFSRNIVLLIRRNIYYHVTMRLWFRISYRVIQNGNSHPISLVWMGMGKYLTLWKFLWEILWERDGNGNRNSIPTATLDWQHIVKYYRSVLRPLIAWTNCIEFSLSCYIRLFAIHYIGWGCQSRVAVGIEFRFPFPSRSHRISCM